MCKQCGAGPAADPGHWKSSPQEDSVEPDSSIPAVEAALWSSSLLGLLSCKADWRDQ